MICQFLRFMKKDRLIIDFRNYDFLTFRKQRIKLLDLREELMLET